MNNIKKIEDEALDQVSGGSGGVIQANNTLFDSKDQVNADNALMDGNTLVTSKLLAGEAKATGGKGNPLTKQPADPFGTDFNAGSGLA